MLFSCSISDTAYLVNNSKKYDYDKMYGVLSYPYWYMDLTKPEPVVSFNKKQLRCLATNMYHEARGEKLANGKHFGMLLVGHTTINRVLSKKYPNTICKVVYQKHQFSWTKNPGSITETNLYDIAEELAYDIVHRESDPSLGAIYFYNPSVVTPRWARSKRVTITYENHRYLK